MCPGLTPGNRPFNQKYSWDMRSCLWTDAHGYHEPYTFAVRRWCLYHVALSFSNLNHIYSELRSPTLQTELHDRAADLYWSISDDIIAPLEGVDAIIHFLDNCNRLLIVSFFCAEFSALLATKSGTIKIHKNFESRFCASVSKYPSHATKISFTGICLVLMLLWDTDVSDS